MRIEKLGIGVISASPIAREHMKGVVANKHAELRAICDIDLPKAQSAADEFNVQCVTTDYKDVIARADIDAVVVATPDQIHAEQVIAYLQAGKHVLCEKPMALIVEECKDMIKAADSTGKKLMIGQVGRYTPGFIQAKKMIDKGLIGELFYVESEYAHDYTDILSVGNWRTDPVKLRHPFVGGGCHAVDLLRWIAGDPWEVTAYANKKVLTQWPVDDCMIAIMKFPRDVIGKVFVSTGCRRQYTMRSVFYGDKGTIITDNTSPQISLFLKNLGEGQDLFEGLSHKHDIEVKYPVAVSSHNTLGEIAEFVDIIINDKPVATDGREGASTVAVCVAAVESAAKGDKVLIRYDF